MRVFLIISALMITVIGEEIQRKWTSQDGRSIEGVFVRGTKNSVTVKRKDGKQVTIPFKILSEEDVKFTQKLMSADDESAKRLTGLKDGPYAKHITGEWEKMKAKDGLDFHFFAGKRLRSNKLYPLCIYLHGASNTGSGLTKREPGANGFADKKAYRDNPCFVIAPEAPAGTGSFQKISGRIFSLIDDLAANLPIDPHRIYITGYSMGARGTWALIAEQPKRFAAAAPIGGPLSGVKLEAIPKIPIWFHYGEKDRGEEFRELAKKLGDINPAFQAKEYEGAGHTGFHSKVAKDEKFYTWLFKQKLGE